MISKRLVYVILAFTCLIISVRAQQPDVTSSVPPIPPPPAPVLVTPPAEQQKIDAPKQDLAIIDEDTGKKIQAQELVDLLAKKTEVKLTPQEQIHVKQSLESGVELNFNNVSLQSLVDQMSSIFNITFLPDDIVKVPDKQLRALAESKISFNTNRSFTRQQAWMLFTKFLELAGWSIVPTSDKQFYRITLSETANKSPLPTYINTPLEILPKSEQRIRYVYFLANSVPDDMISILAKIANQRTQIEQFKNLRALLLTDTAANVFSLMQLVQELDKTTDAQVVSVLNLKEVDANEVVTLMGGLQKQDEPSPSPWMPVRKEASLYYFPKDVKLVPASRTNSLIIMGPKEGVERFEHFIMTYIDTTLKQTYQPLNVYELSYAPAKQIADILNNVVKFGKKGSGGQQGNASVGDAGGVLGGLKYFGDVRVEAEQEGNRLLVYASQEDFKHLSNIIKQLDKRQPQVAIEVMIVAIDIDNIRKWGMQWNTKQNRTFNAQMSGFWGSQAVLAKDPTPAAPWANSLISNLIDLATKPEAGTLLMTLGRESVYAICGMMQNDQYTRVLANPFVVATNKYKATVAVGTTRMAKFQEVSGGLSGNNEVEAAWSVSITPQINSEGTVNLDIGVKLVDFTNLDDPRAPASNANTQTREVQTNANVADKEVIALGGLINRKKQMTKSQVPILSRIPIIGNLFKNESRENESHILVIFMSPTIIQPTEDVTNVYTRNKSEYLKKVSLAWHNAHEATSRDPIYRWMFKPIDQDIDVEMNDFMKRGASKKSASPVPESSDVKVETKKDVIMSSVTPSSASEQKKGA